MTLQQQATAILSRWPKDHDLYSELQRMPEVFAAVMQSIDHAETFAETRELSRWCEAQAARFQALGRKALEKETA